MLYGQIRKNLGDVFHDLARQKESRVLEGHLQSDHVHMLISIPPKYAVSQMVGYLKGKSAIHIARTYRLFVVSSGIPWDFGGHKRCNCNTAQVDNPRDRSTSL